MTISPQSGTGPGSITPDGSPVEFYTLLRPRGEAEIVGQVTPSGGSVLELGSGVGRVTHALLEHGFEVVAVNESAEMLARITGAQTVRSRIQDLRLERRFDAVMLASFLVHTTDEDGARALLSACARHVAPGGAVLIEWTPPETHDAQQVGRGRTDGDITITLVAREEVGPGLFSATMRYAHGDRVWTQSFTSRRLSDDDLRAALTESGLHLDRFLTDDRRWVLAVPAA